MNGGNFFLQIQQGEEGVPGFIVLLHNCPRIDSQFFSVLPIVLAPRNFEVYALLLKELLPSRSSVHCRVLPKNLPAF